MPHFFAESGSGLLFSVGSNDKSQLGIGNFESRTTATLVGGALSSLSVTAFASGVSHLVAAGLYTSKNSLCVCVLILFFFCLALSSALLFFLKGFSGADGRAYLFGSELRDMATPTAVSGDLSSVAVVAASASAHSLFLGFLLPFFLGAFWFISTTTAEKKIMPSLSFVWKSLWFW